MDRRKSKLEIIEFVVNHFKTNPRAILDNGPSCKYLTNDGKRCAHSICIEDRIVKDIGDRTTTAQTVIHSYGDRMHKPEFQGHEVIFWQNIQNLHDNSMYWKNNDQGGSNLTDEGQARVVFLVKKYRKSLES